MNVKTLINYDNDVYCTESKLRIMVGEIYAIVSEEIYGGQVIEKPYKLGYLPVEGDDPYICK